MNVLVSRYQRQEFEVKLCFALGVRLPTLITFTVKVKTTGPLEIGDIIEEALSTRCDLHVQWRLIEGHIKADRPKLHTGVPKYLIEELKRALKEQASDLFLHSGTGLGGLVHGKYPIHLCHLCSSVCAALKIASNGSNLYHCGLHQTVPVKVQYHGCNNLGPSTLLGSDTAASKTNFRRE